jgi:arylformamidase
VGIDYLSIEKFGRPKPDAHLALLSAGVVIIEGLDLSEVEGNRAYTLACLPLKVPGIDGAPARAVLLE